MKEFWDCLGPGQAAIITIGLLPGLFLLGQVPYWSLRCLGRFKARKHPWWIESWAAGYVLFAGALLILGLIDIIYCLICPECGGLL
ncbi:hypothetical protein LCGC14_1130860 [marine sediment metagenome]|uniref:Uncharacterized protein n=1 Tax=marine sediment metagenome TaxID=412755 RepID=A0A0F9M107_9ZZZZ